MSKGLEAFKKISEIYGNTGSLEGTYEYFLIIKRALVRLEAIDNSNPSEALKELEQMREFGNHFWVADKVNKSYMTIKEALLKTQENVRSEEILQKYYQEGITLDSVRALREENAELRQKTQEPKHYLKWEDLEFEGNNEYSYFKVKLGDNVYKAFSYFSYVFNKDTVVIKTNNQFAITEDNKQFFNDLHLERVEE